MDKTSPVPNMALYTSYQVNVTKRMQDGQTLFFQDELEAIKVARRMRSYHYQVFNHKMQHAGYAVPK